MRAFASRRSRRLSEIGRKFSGINGGRTRDRTLDLSRVKGTLSLVSPPARPKNRIRTAAYAAYDFVVSYAIRPVFMPSGTRLGPVLKSAFRSLWCNALKVDFRPWIVAEQIWRLRFRGISQQELTSLADAILVGLAHSFSFEISESGKSSRCLLGDQITALTIGDNASV